MLYWVMKYVLLGPVLKTLWPTKVVGAENIPRAPRTLIETTRNFRTSKVARDWFGDDFVDHFAATREWEWRQSLDAVTDWELKRYFEII